MSRKRSTSGKWVGLAHPHTRSLAGGGGQALIDYDLIASLSNHSELERFANLARNADTPVKIHLKVDTGMGRMGAWWEEAPTLLGQVMQTSGLDPRAFSPTSPTPPTMLSPVSKGPFPGGNTARLGEIP